MSFQATPDCGHNVATLVLIQSHHWLSPPSFHAGPQGLSISPSHPKETSLDYDHMLQFLVDILTAYFLLSVLISLSPSSLFSLLLFLLSPSLSLPLCLPPFPSLSLNLSLIYANIPSWYLTQIIPHNLVNKMIHRGNYPAGMPFSLGEKVEERKKLGKLIH